MQAYLPEFTMEAKEKLILYSSLLKKWQKKFNLVGNSTLAHICERHFQDSAQLYSLLPIEEKDAPVYDIGTGAGFPGMVLAIMGRKDIILCEANQKKGSATEGGPFLVLFSLVPLGRAARGRGGLFLFAFLPHGFGVIHSMRRWATLRSR